MKFYWQGALAITLIGNLVVTGLLLKDRSKNRRSQEPFVIQEISQTTDLESKLQELRDEVAILQTTLSELPPSVDVSTANDKFEKRFKGIESSLSRLESAMNGLSIEEASTERQALFEGENGHLKAAEYFAAEKYELAGQGYLAFLTAHPDHPEHRSLVKKARQAFSLAGNMDRAIAIQEELMEIYPENKAGDLMTLARLQQEAGKYEEAAANANESAGLVNDSSKYWNLLYSAWYTQLGEGLDAGLAAHREVEAQIDAAGHGDGKLGERVREKIAEIERERVAQGE